MPKFARDRSDYRQRLCQAIIEQDFSLLTYNITCNHVQLVAYAESSGQVASLMQQASGEFARDYNRRKSRSGAFWEGRHPATMVDFGEYLWQCLKYVELNMERCGVIGHPRQWEWSGYAELMGGRKRNQLLDVAKLRWLVRATTIEEFQAHFKAVLDEVIINDEPKNGG